VELDRRLAHSNGMNPALTRVTCVLAVGLGAVLLTPAAASAKGPSQAFLDGPGISSPIPVRDPNDATIGPDLAALVEQSGLFAQLSCSQCDGRMNHRPTGELGPRYRATYTVGATAGVASPSNQIIQYLFPYALPDPVTYMPAGQRFLTQKTVGGWFVASPRLRHLLNDLGVPLRDSAQPGEPTPAVANGQPWRPPLALVALTLVSLMGLIAVNRGRQRKQHTGIGA
jgi:hypothetical protein